MLFRSIEACPELGRRGYEREHTFTLIQNSLSGLKLSFPLFNQEILLALPGMFGEFNAYNSMMSFLVCLQLGVQPSAIQEALVAFPGVPGRLQSHQLINGAQAFVDFAHNAPSFQGVLSALRTLTPKLIVVFGCGGDKDKARRPAMGQLAAHYADIVIITDDNPRSEDRHAIIQDIIAGIPEESQAKVICQPDRKKAIALAAQLSDKNSVIALLGKGHETYYLVKDQKIYFNDLEEIKQF